MLIPASFNAVAVTVWSAYMKTVLSFIFLFIAAQASPNLFAEEAENTPAKRKQQVYPMQTTT
jgi:hypothetical protein